MDILEVQKKIENNKECISIAKQKINQLKDKLKEVNNEEQQQNIENTMADYRREILEYQKNEFGYKNQIKKIELQNMREELDNQLVDGRLISDDYDTKVEKLKQYKILQDLYTEYKIAECDEKSQQILSCKSGYDDKTKMYLINQYLISRKETRTKEYAYKIQSEQMGQDIENDKGVGTFENMYKDMTASVYIQKEGLDIDFEKNNIIDINQNLEIKSVINNKNEMNIDDYVSKKVKMFFVGDSEQEELEIQKNFQVDELKQLQERIQNLEMRSLVEENLRKQKEIYMEKNRQKE